MCGLKYGNWLDCWHQLVRLKYRLKPNKKKRKENKIIDRQTLPRVFFLVNRSLFRSLCSCVVFVSSWHNLLRDQCVYVHYNASTPQSGVLYIIMATLPLFSLKFQLLSRLYLSSVLPLVLPPVQWACQDRSPLSRACKRWAMYARFMWKWHHCLTKKMARWGGREQW